MADLREARASIRGALRGFRWAEYQPFFWMMLLELAFLLCAVNLGTPWGMAGAGWLLRTLGEPATHYPGSFVALTAALGRFMWIVSGLWGSYLVPLSLVRIRAAITGRQMPRPEMTALARRAYLPTLLSQFANVALLVGWDALLRAGPSRWIHAFRPGLLGDVLTWALGFLGAYALSAVFLYVPMRALTGASTGDALGGGVREGLARLGPTLLIVFFFVWPTLLVLAPLELAPAIIVTRLRPGLIGVLAAALTILSSLVNYLIYSAAARFRAFAEPQEA